MNKVYIIDCNFRCRIEMKKIYDISRYTNGKIGTIYLGKNVKKLILKESYKKYCNWEIFEIDKLLVEGKNTTIEGWNKKHQFLGKIYTVSGSKAVKWAKKGKSAVEIASMYGILRITPITPEVIRISFVKGVTAKVQDTYWKPKADTAFPWSAKESKTAVLVETEKLRVMVEKKDGAVQFLMPDNKPILSEKRDEPRMIDGGMTWTFFDWSGSEKLKAKGILSTEWLDLTAKARYVSFGGKQARMPLLVSNRGYGIAAAASRTALLCNVRTFGTYLHTAGDGQIDYYFILGKDREEIVKQYKEL